jgi:hypothetical protein
MALSTPSCIEDRAIARVVASAAVCPHPLSPEQRLARTRGPQARPGVGVAVACGAARRRAGIRSGALAAVAAPAGPTAQAAGAACCRDGAKAKRAAATTSTGGSVAPADADASGTRAAGRTAAAASAAPGVA